MRECRCHGAGCPLCEEQDDIPEICLDCEFREDCEYDHDPVDCGAVEEMQNQLRYDHDGWDES